LLWGKLNNILIENCYINGNDDLGVRILNKVENVRFLNCHIDKDEVDVEGVDYLIFENCKFDRSEITLAYAPSDYTQFYNCTFNITTENYISIKGSHTIIENCTFLNCDGAAIILWSSNGATIRDCVITNDMYGHTYGIYFQGRNFLMERVTINGTTFGLYFHYGGWNVVVRKCNFSNNQRAVQYYGGGRFNRFIQNNFVNNGYNFVNEDLLFMFNIFQNNYWSDWGGKGPYHVYGLLNWDFFPAKEPHNI